MPRIVGVCFEVRKGSVVAARKERASCVLVSCCIFWELVMVVGRRGSVYVQIVSR